MAFESWMAAQDRSGIEIGPAVAVPANSSTFSVRLVDVGFVSPAQTVQVTMQVSYNGGQTWQDSGEGPTWLGGAKNKDKQGNDIPWEFGGGWPPVGSAPTHARVVTQVAGTINCGVDVDVV